jgi:hypothetical protein
MAYMKYIIVAVLVGLCVGCPREENEEEKARRADYTITHIAYVQDSKTGLCFAVSQLGLANVPCEKVKNFFTYVESNTRPDSARYGASNYAMHKMR